MYTIDGDELDSQDHPNVFFLPRDITESVSLKMLRQHFPLEGDYHFRFKLPGTDGGSRRGVWRDMRCDEDLAPINDQKKLFLRVLRLRAEGDNIPPASVPVPAAASSAPDTTAPTSSTPQATPAAQTREREDSMAMPANFFDSGPGPQSPSEGEAAASGDAVSPSPAGGAVASPTPANPEEQKMVDLKGVGNDHFKKGEFPDAIAAYTSAVELYDGLETKTPTADKTVSACLNNRAACRIQVREFDDAILDATRVLALEPKNAKALLRRGTCYEHIEKYKQSKADMEGVLSIDPGSRQAKDILNRVKKVMKALYG